MVHQRGISLAELLISLLLSSFIITVLMNLYLNNKQLYVAVEKTLAMEFDVQWVTELLSDSIRRAGFTPCVSIDQLNVNGEIFQGTTIPALIIENNPTHSIHVNRMHENFATLIEIKNATHILAEHRGFFHQKRPLLIADCEHAELLHIAQMEQNGKNLVLTLNKSLHFTYSKDAYIGEYIAERWFIKKNNQGNEALYYQLMHAEEMTSLIHSMQSMQERRAGKQIVSIALGLTSGKIQKLDIAVRGS